MAILSEDGNEYEVRVVRVPQDTRFKEFIKVGECDNHSTKACERYIIAEPGQTYAAEVVIRRGFHWDEYDQIEIELAFADAVQPISGRYISKGEFDTPDDYTIYLDCVNFEELGRTVDAPFTFRKVAVDERLHHETNIIGVDPHSLSSFTVSICRDYTIFWNGSSPRSKDYRGLLETFRAASVDQQSFKKHGIMYGTGLDSAKNDPGTLMCRSNDEFITSKQLWYTYHYRTEEFLEQLNIVPYPPPLHCYPWAILKDFERKIALRELQEYSRGEHRERTGFSVESVDGGSVRREWPSWYQMNTLQRKIAFETLQEEHKGSEREEALKEIVLLPSHKFIIIDENGPKAGYVISSNPRNANAQGPRPAARGGIKQEEAVKQELIDVDVGNTGPRSGDRTNKSMGPPKLPRHVAIKQERIDVDALEDQKTVLLPAPTIKHELPKKEARGVKRVKVEDEYEMVDLPAKRMNVEREVEVVDLSEIQVLQLESKE
ncbi:hypothetical protein DL98DRAFT_655165 [Cadophora sp. DSE1049]|nr:hypothetical protein DL98DRAFT_655165 [Cadophora sp. DSE1049]